MSPEDRAIYDKARPYLLGIVALVMKIAGRYDNPDAFDRAEAFLAEFEKRSG